MNSFNSTPRLRQSKARRADSFLWHGRASPLAHTCGGGAGPRGAREGEGTSQDDIRCRSPHDLSAMTEARYATAHARHHPLTLPPQRGGSLPLPQVCGRGALRPQPATRGEIAAMTLATEHFVSLPAASSSTCPPECRSHSDRTRATESTTAQSTRNHCGADAFLTLSPPQIHSACALHGHRSALAGGSLPAARRSAVALSLGVSPRGSIDLWCCGLRYARSAAVQPTRRNLGAAQK
jgi:hypothetical protein